MFRRFATCVAFLATAAWASASFTLSGNPAADPGWTHSGHSLANGGYVRGTGNFSYNIYNIEFNLQSGTNPLTTTGWAAGSRIIGIGGVVTQNSVYTAPEFLGWPSGTVFTGPSQNQFAGANNRVNAKFGVNNLSNTYNGSSTPPNVSTGAAGSHSGGNGGLGSVQVSIASNRFLPGNAGVLTIPTITTGGPVTGPDNVAQFNGVNPNNGLDLFDAGSGTFPSARYIYTTDPNTGFLSSWQVLLNTSLVSAYPGSFPTVPTGGSDWVTTLQAGSGQFTDGLITTDPFSVAPAPPAILLALFGGVSLLGLRKRMK